ncbi:MAG TPA: sigma factor [Aquabacterium sp.]|nr:sigma factor [Aquabacterium sp.]HQC95985.1 sigma factor [Aquabacterium sp.]
MSTTGATVESLYRQHARRVFSTLVRLLGSFDLAEEALHDAFLAATEQWPAQGVPANPVAWLVSAGRFKAIDRLRRDRRFSAWDDALDETLADPAPGPEQLADARSEIADDRLRLVFTCCHPSLAEEARIALTLREVCGLTTEAIAAAFLVATPTLAQRIVRAKAKIAAARIPYEVPGTAELPARLASVLRVVYLVFNEGHAARDGDLAGEAIRLARLLLQLLPEPPAEARGLLALLLLTEARRAARLDAAGTLVPLDQQDRRLWDAALIAEGSALAEAALRQRGFGAYALQAAIAAVHAEAATADATDWPQIIGLYDALLRLEPTPVVALNRAVAVAMRDGAAVGLAQLRPLLPALAGYPAASAAAADLCRRAGLLDEARLHYQAAVALARQAPERAHLAAQLAALGG